ncbi:MAG: lytic transglycosylase domain-containing protein, partial [Candidatus Eremiobacteraeota bacterium]|nr:lytic transglycosylase domain-containing protein [Candidatus Eremiobacteraeota bacterium]
MGNSHRRCRYGNRSFAVIARRIGGAVLAIVLTGAALTPASAAPYSSTAQYARVLRTFNPNLSHAQSHVLADHVRTEALYYRLDARLLVALVAIESSWHPYVTSPVGAGGLGQLMPGTAAGLGVNAYQPFSNLNGTAHYLRGLLDRFGGYNQNTRYQFALAGYNAGPGAVERYGGVPPYTETQNYVRNVMGIWQRLTRSLSSHIDDAGADSTRIALSSTHTRRLAVIQPVRAGYHRAVKTTKVHPVLPIEAMVADADQATPSPKEKTHKPFLYYVFHRHHREDPPA